MATAATEACGAVWLIAKLRFVPSICRIECGGSFSIALVGNELAEKVLRRCESSAGIPRSV
jgi:hypothetical protein